jgi:hypothetical protein
MRTDGRKDGQSDFIDAPQRFERSEKRKDVTSHIFHIIYTELVLLIINVLS